ncbi:MAG: AtpZ/AtpI family protein [Planctomycetaceae bacterium]
MSLPAAGGYWLDKSWGTSPWLLALGAVLGFYVAMKHLLALAQRSKRELEPKTQDEQSRHQPGNHPSESDPSGKG